MWIEDLDERGVNKALNNFPMVEFSTHTAKPSYNPFLEGQLHRNDQAPYLESQSFESYLQSLNRKEQTEGRNDGYTSISNSEYSIPSTESDYGSRGFKGIKGPEEDSSRETSDYVKGLESRKSNESGISKNREKEDRPKVPENTEKKNKKSHLKDVHTETKENSNADSSVKAGDKKTGKIHTGAETAEKAGNTGDSENEIVLDLQAEAQKEEAQRSDTLVHSTDPGLEGLQADKRGSLDEKNSTSLKPTSSRIEGSGQEKDSLVQSMRNFSKQGETGGSPGEEGREGSEKGSKFFVLDQRELEAGKLKGEKNSEIIDSKNENGERSSLRKLGEENHIKKAGDNSGNFESSAKTKEGGDISFFRTSGGKEVQGDTPPGKQEGVFVSLKERQQLIQQLKEKGNRAIVKQSGFILKSDSSGEIRLVLKPERLGNVKIRINLEDNNIAGKIIVENSTVRDIFEQNLEQLYRSFRESGYQTAQLEVSVGNGKNGKGNPGHGADKGHTRGMGILEENLGIEEGNGFFGDYTIDLVV